MEDSRFLKETCVKTTEVNEKTISNIINFGNLLLL